MGLLLFSDMLYMTAVSHVEFIRSCEVFVFAMFDCLLDLVSVIVVVCSLCVFLSMCLFVFCI